MKGMVPPDPETEVSRECFAVVRAGRRARNRFPAACVEPVADRDRAVEMAANRPGLRAARLVGPSKSSEGQYIYYLLEWL